MSRLFQTVFTCSFITRKERMVEQGRNAWGNKEGTHGEQGRNAWGNKEGTHGEQGRNAWRTRKESMGNKEGTARGLGRCKR